MPNLSVMKARIATELDRSDITAPIASAISDAIAEYEQDRFWFNESRDLTFSTVAAQRIYTTADATWIPDVIEIDALFASVGGRNRPLTKTSPEEMEMLADNSSSTGGPSSWAYLNKSIQLYPIPDTVYTVRAIAHYRLTALASDTESNAWTTEAERLIRRRAKLLLAGEVTMDATAAQAALIGAEDAYDKLKAESSRRRATGIIKGSGF